MTDAAPAPVEIVRGELQPWTDYGAHRPAGGAALLALLGDLLPERSARTLVAGPHHRAVIELAAARTGALTVLVRSVSDATELREALPAPHVTVVTGALDGFTGAAPFDVVLAADGLDRVLGADSPALGWPGRMAELDRLAAAGALVVVAVENEFALTGLLDRRPADARHGDEEWRPLHDDPDRPTSPAQVTAALGGEVRLYAAYPAHTLLDADVLAKARPGRLGTRLATAGLTATATGIPLLAPVADGADAAARAGLLAAVAPGWLAVRGSGGGATHDGYAAAGDGVLAVDFDEDDGWTVGVRSGATASFDPSLVPHRLPDTASVETLLFRLAAAEDVPGFRALAARVGAWANPEGVLCLDDLYPDGDGFSRGVLGHPAAAGEGTAELLAGAWHRFRDRLLGAHRRHPWPPWMAGTDDLVSAWLGMSGVEGDAAVVKAGREVADRVAEPAVAEPDVRAVLAGAAAAEVRITELAGQVFGLERTIRFRDQSLRTREQQLRSMRDELRGLRRSPAGRLHAVARRLAKIRHPRQFARAVKRRLRGA